MALVECPECKNKISDKANQCPNCGYPISEELLSYQLNVEEKNTEEISDYNPKRSPLKRIIALAILVGLIIIPVVIYVKPEKFLSGKFYRYNESDKTYNDRDYFEFSGENLTYHENGSVYSCDYSQSQDTLEIKLDNPRNPLNMTFIINKDKNTIESQYDVFKKITESDDAVFNLEQKAINKGL